MRVYAAGIAALALIGLSGVAINAPALSPGLRDGGLFGDWRTVRPSSLYHRGDYAYDVGFAYLQADLLPADATEPANVLADQLTSAERANHAVHHLEKAVAMSPGSGRSWSALAWAHALDGDMVKAARALETSWQVAPHNTYLATQRLPLFALLSETDAGKGLAEAAAQDAADLKRFRKRYFRLTFADQPAIAALISSD